MSISRLHFRWVYFNMVDMLRNESSKSKKASVGQKPKNDQSQKTKVSFEIFERLFEP